MATILNEYSEVIASIFYIIASIISVFGVTFGFRRIRIFLRIYYRRDYYPIRIEENFLKRDDNRYQFKFVNLGNEDILIDKITLTVGRYNLDRNTYDINESLTIRFDKEIDVIPKRSGKDKANTHAIQITTDEKEERIKLIFEENPKTKFMRFRIIYNYKGVKKVATQLYHNENKEEYNKYKFKQGSVRGTEKK